MSRAVLFVLAWLPTLIPPGVCECRLVGLAHDACVQLLGDPTDTHDQPCRPHCPTCEGEPPDDRTSEVSVVLDLPVLTASFDPVELRDPRPRTTARTVPARTHGPPLFLAQRSLLI